MMEDVNVTGLTAALQSRRPTMMDSNAAYAVLCPLVEMADGQWGLLFEVRAATLRSQPKEVCFPGGRMEPGETPTQTALRETQEELSLPPQVIAPIGEVDFIASAGGFIMHPVVAVVEDLTALRPAKEEVDHTFIVPISFFRNTKPLVAAYDLVPQVPSDFPFGLLGIASDYPFASKPVETPVWMYQGHAIWGMTARIVRHLLQVLENLHP